MACSAVGPVSGFVRFSMLTADAVYVEVSATEEFGARGVTVVKLPRKAAEPEDRTEPLPFATAPESVTVEPPPAPAPEPELAGTVEIEPDAMAEASPDPFPPEDEDPAEQPDEASGEAEDYPR